jgi:ABC-type ATPase involved in cell division
LKLLNKNSSLEGPSVTTENAELINIQDTELAQLRKHSLAFQDNPIKSADIAERVALLLSARIQRQYKKAISAQANQSKELILELLA